MTTFVQGLGTQTTLKLWDQMFRHNELASLAAFAYVTDSGVAQIGRGLRNTLWAPGRQRRWLLGIDYGRSQPTALRKLAELGSTEEIRIHDGRRLIESTGLIPGQTFHLKTVFALEEHGRARYQLVGSGNLSSFGLSLGIEAGCLVDYGEDGRRSRTVVDHVERLWEAATPLKEIIDEYEDLYRKLNKPRKEVGEGDLKLTGLFWIDVGYVTKNRGSTKPGNQFDLPSGAHAFLGLAKRRKTPKRNTEIGVITMRTPSGDSVPRVLRMGNNMMEKLTLPTPEDHGFGCYDGKILLFDVREDAVLLTAFEREDFARIFRNNDVVTAKMRSGRSYGTLRRLG